ncbi:helix-turn-helix domain-containing protein [Paractinoplanes lichenicola]|uniref:GAF domain-containing protein n=1 Tax=Paractinoplanes lichenicola TaxID=2802976 RepID=A0ABS1VVQ7_9ACTN|nr:GAF domain-containing protein [Actinoplanes lichenicola]MBL7258535.1 GAF domain-containing protein [Actinoplanes lichenicola]
MQTTGAVQLRPWLEAIAAIATALNRPVSLPEVLDLVSGTAANLLGYDFCAVLLVDEERTKLVITGAHGLSPRYIEQVNADHPVVLEPAGEPRAPSSRAFLTGTSVQVADTVADATFLPWGGVARQQGYRSMISVPVFSAGRPVGTLNCYTRIPHDFGPGEQELLSLLAEQAGVAIQTARLREREAATIADLLRAEEVHEQFTRVALRGGGVAGVAAALAELMSTPVLVVEEPSEVPLAAVGPPVDGEGHSTPVVLGNETVARIVVPAPSSPLPALDVRALEHAATVCALEILRARTAHEVEWRLSGEVVTDLLAGLTTAVERAARLGIDLTKPHSVIVVSGGPARVLSVARSLAAAAQPRALVGTIGDDVVLLWAADATGHAAALLAQLRRAGAGPETAVAVSPPCTEPADYPAAYRRGRGAATIARLRGRTDTVASFESLGVHGLLLQLQDIGELRRFAAETLAPLRTYDAARGTALEQTLRAYVTNDLNTAATAAALFVHPNTVNLRIRKAEQLLGVSTSHVRVLAELQVALNADDVADALTTPGATGLVT